MKRLVLMILLGTNLISATMESFEAQLEAAVTKLSFPGLSEPPEGWVLQAGREEVLQEIQEVLARAGMRYEDAFGDNKAKDMESHESFATSPGSSELRSVDPLPIPSIKGLKTETLSINNKKIHVSFPAMHTNFKSRSVDPRSVPTKAYSRRKKFQVNIIKSHESVPQFKRSSESNIFLANNNEAYKTIPTMHDSSKSSSANLLSASDLSHTEQVNITMEGKETIASLPMTRNISKSSGMDLLSSGEHKRTDLVNPKSVRDEVAAEMNEPQVRQHTVKRRSCPGGVGSYGFNSYNFLTFSMQVFNGVINAINNINNNNNNNNDNSQNSIQINTDQISSNSNSANAVLVIVAPRRRKRRNQPFCRTQEWSSVTLHAASALLPLLREFSDTQSRINEVCRPLHVCQSARRMASNVGLHKIIWKSEDLTLAMAEAPCEVLFSPCAEIVQNFTSPPK